MEKIEFENRLLDAIKKDDLKSFSLLMPTNADMNLCFGRFPLLSLLYLYSSFKILSKYENVLMPIHNFRVVEERFEIYKRFKSKARQTIRLFLGDEIIYPVLMLAVLNEKNILKHNFKFLFKNVEINVKLSKIYKLKHNLQAECEGLDNVKIQSEKPTKVQSLLFVAVSIICCLFIAFSSIAMVFVKNTTGLGTEECPIKITTKQEFLSALRYEKRTYVLENDIEIDGSEFVDKNFSGKILGNNHTISISGEIGSSLIKELSGQIENLKFKLNNNRIKITQNWALIAENSSGIIENCLISGSFSGEYNSEDDSFVGMFVAKNSGEIKLSQINVSATLVNKKETNAYFGNVVGINDGLVENCKSSSGIVVADTVDLGGIACQNNGEIRSSENRITMSQTSNKQWHPNIAGVSIVNNGKILGSKNYAELNASSTRDEDTDNKYYVFVGGVSCENYGEISDCRNFGKIIAKGNISNVVAGGLVSQNVEDEKGNAGLIISSLSKSDIDVKSEMGSVCVGGVVGLNASSVNKSGFIGIIDADSNAKNDKDVFVSNLDKELVVIAGGVVGVNQYSELKNSYADASFLANGNTIVPAVEESVQKLYAGIVGNVGIFAYYETLIINPFYPNRQYKTDAMERMDKNYYVEKTEITESSYGVFGTTENWSYVSGLVTAMTDEILTNYFGKTSTVFNKCSSLSETPLEVIYE